MPSAAVDAPALAFNVEPTPSLTPSSASTLHPTPATRRTAAATSRTRASGQARVAACLPELPGLPSTTSPLSCAYLRPSWDPARTRPELPPPLLPRSTGSPRSPLLHPSSRPNDPVLSFLGLHRCSPNRLPPPRATRPLPPRHPMAAVALLPRSSHLRSPFVQTEPGNRSTTFP